MKMCYAVTELGISLNSLKQNIFFLLVMQPIYHLHIFRGRKLVLSSITDSYRFSYVTQLLVSFVCDLWNIIIEILTIFTVTAVTTLLATFWTSEWAPSC